MVNEKYLTITDRKKEIFKTSTGKNIAPQPIEQRFRESPFIDNIMILGEDRKYVAALIVPNFEYLKSWCRLKGVEYRASHWVIRNQQVIRRIHEEVQRFNRVLGQTEKVKKFKLLDREWTTESGELSPTLKPRRRFIQEKYYEDIEEAYRSPEYNYKSPVD